MQETTNWQDDAALERFQMISPLLDPDMDNAKRIQLRREIASSHDLSERTIYRYEKRYRENAFAGLRPMNRKMRRSARLPDNWDEIVGEAIILKREVPKRSARQIIKTLEIEGWAAPGVVKESTLRRYLYKAGLGVKQMRRYAEARETSSRRFCRPHRMELLQADIKYGPDIRTKDGKLIHTYLSSLIDDHSRFILHSEFYDNKSASTRPSSSSGNLTVATRITEKNTFPPSWSRAVRGSASASSGQSPAKARVRARLRSSTESSTGSSKRSG